MTTLQQVELGVLGPVQVRQYGLPVAIPGAKPRAILTMFGLHDGSIVPADTLIELLWGDDPPRTAAKALQTHISALRRSLGDGFVLTEGTGWRLSTTKIDATDYKSAAKLGRDALATGDASEAVARFEQALTLWRDTPELPDSPRGKSEKTRWIEDHAALVEDRADALLATGRAAEIIGELEAAIADSPLRERRWGHLMLALYRAGRQGEALGAFQRARSLLADELGVDPGPDLRRLEAALVAQDVSLELPVSHQLSAVTRAVTFLLTDIEGSTAAWEANADAMAASLARHDEIVEQVVTFRGGRLIKTRGEGDATFSVFDRPSGAAAAAIELQEAIRREPWPLVEPMRIRVALHTGEVEFRDGDYFGRAVNRAARLRSLAAGGQILCSGATAELVIDTLADDVVLDDLGMRQLKNLARPEHVFELRIEADDSRTAAVDSPVERPLLPAVLSGSGPFVGRGRELERLLAAWQNTQVAGSHAVLIAGEPGVGKTRLAGEWSRQAYEQGAIVVYGRCDEDLGAPYQPFSEALRSLVPGLGTNRLRGLRGVEALIPLIPELTEVLPELAAPPRADPDTERYALFDAVGALLGVAATSTPVILVLDDLHWAAKPTLLLLRHLLRFGEHARVQIVGTYRSTDLDRSHPLAAMLADLHRDGSVTRLTLGGLDEDDVTAYVHEVGYDDEELARALASVTGGNPFFLIEALRHVDESGGRWDPTTLPQGVREAVGRRLSRLPEETNTALATAAVVGSRFELALVERVVGHDLVDAFDESAKAGIVIEEPGGRYRFNHAIVRQSLLAELASVRRMRLHQRIATTLESEPGADDELLAELAYHYFECAWAGNAAKAVDYCRRAADQAMARLAYEGAADLYGKAVHALEDLDDELPDRDEQRAELLVARCEALLAAGDVGAAKGAVSQLRSAAGHSGRLAAWGTCFDAQLSMLTDPERLDEIESALTVAAESLAQFEDAAGEAKAHTVRAGVLARLGRIGDAETALDQALTAARRAREHRRVNAVLAGAPLAALLGPNPVPRAGGRCLDVVRLLRITTGSPVVEATSTRCQGVLDAFRGRANAGRQLIESARRSLTELGMRHALLEVDQFAGIVELVADDPAAAEPHLRRAYNGFRRMGLDADTAETAALLARTCLALGGETEADELCTESERLAGHDLKAAIAWRALRAQLMARAGDHDGARRIAEEAVAIAERTDLLVDHGDACLALATVLTAAGDIPGARAAGEKAVGLYELKGAAALAEKARGLLSVEGSASRAAGEPPSAEPDNLCVRALRTMEAALNREDWDAFDQMWAADVFVESRRKIVGFTQADLSSSDWPREARRLLHIAGAMRARMVGVLAVRGERLALTRLEFNYADTSPGAPKDELLVLTGMNDEDRIAIHVVFDVDDIDAAMAELEAQHARFEQEEVPSPAINLENSCVRTLDRVESAWRSEAWHEAESLVASRVDVANRRKIVGVTRGELSSAEWINEARQFREPGMVRHRTSVVAIRGERLALKRVQVSTVDTSAGAPQDEMLILYGIDDRNRVALQVTFDSDDLDAAIAELDARYVAGEAAPYALTWSVVARVNTALNERKLPATTSNWVTIDHRRVTPIASSEMTSFIRASWQDYPKFVIHIEAVHRLSDVGAVVTWAGHATSLKGFEAEWRVVNILTADDDRISRTELFDEADVEEALARFDELSRPAICLENSASRMYALFNRYFAARNWDAMSDLISDDMLLDDRRRVVNAGIRRGREAALAETRSVADIGTREMSSDVIATRGDRLALLRTRAAGQNSASFQTEALHITEIAHDQVAAYVAFDPDDLDAAFAELDARYLAGEAAPQANTWTILADCYAKLDRHELPPTTPDWVDIDHQRLGLLERGTFFANVEASWELMPDWRIHIAAVHRLTGIGAVITWAARGTSRQAFAAELHGIALHTVEGDLVDRCELFDDVDLEAALARFDELDRPVQQLENTASQVYERLWKQFEAGDWRAIADLFTEDISNDDRRRVVNAGIERGRDIQMENLRCLADIGATISRKVLATRGDRLILNRIRTANSDLRLGEFDSEMFTIIETDLNNRITVGVLFDSDDVDAAFAELDALYLAGEARPHANTWSVITQAYAEMARGVIPAATPDLANIDHPHVTPMAPDAGTDYLRASWDIAKDASHHIEYVHRLSNLGAVFTRRSDATSPMGFEAEWRAVDLIMVEGDRISRGEIFGEADVDAALARFDELSRPAKRLENAASRLYERRNAYFAERDWDAMAETLADDIFSDDRRRVVSAGTSRGRDAQMANNRAAAAVGVTTITSTVIATRGERLALSRTRISGSDNTREPFYAELLGIVEIDADERMVAYVAFDLDDIDAAFDVLETRYLAGEAAAYEQTWSTISRLTGTFNRRGIPAGTDDFVSIDHRKGTAFAPGELLPYLRAMYDLTPQATIHTEKVHRLNNVGAVFVNAAHAISQDGFAAEWRVLSLVTVNGDLLSRYEVFDEDDLETALARFDELSTSAPQLENAATRQNVRLADAFNRRDAQGYLGTVAAHAQCDDRRIGLRYEGPVNAEFVHGLFTEEARSWRLAVEPIAIRGHRLALSRHTYRDAGDPDSPIAVEALTVTDVTDDDLARRFVVFDADSVDAALAELDARYLAGEAAEHAHAWTVVANHHAAFNRRELPAEPLELLDHRRLVTIEPGDPTSTILDMWDFTPDLKLYIEAVHRLSDLGAVFTQVSHGTSQTGFGAEWRVVELVTIDGDLVSQAELFDESDLAAALARFDELSASVPRLANAATRQFVDIAAAFNDRDPDRFLGAMTPNARYDDRRKGLHNEGPVDAELVHVMMSHTAEGWRLTIEPFAIRGDYLALSQYTYRDLAEADRPIVIEAVVLTEVSDDQMENLSVVFDLDDRDAAFAELDARYLAGEAADYARTWSAIAGAYAALNRHELPATTPHWINLDHRHGSTFEPGQMAAYLRSAWDLQTDRRSIEAVHALNNLGAVVTRTATATSREGFDAEWRAVDLVTVDRDLINRCELFDESDLDAALARFDELSAPAPRLDNAATRQNAPIVDAFNRRDVDGYLARMDSDAQYDDRRKGLRNEGPVDADFVRALMSDAATSWQVESEPIAIRERHLALSCWRYRENDEADRPVAVEALVITEFTDDELLRRSVVFDPDDADAAFAELDVRYIAGEAAPHAHAWSAISRSFAAFNSHELLSSAIEFVDRRRLVGIGPSDLTNTTQAAWDMTRNIRTRIESVHRLNDGGAVITHSAYGTSQEGFDFELRVVDVFTIDKDAVTRCEVFDEADLDAALARFDELNR